MTMSVAIAIAIVIAHAIVGKLILMLILAVVIEAVVVGESNVRIVAELSLSLSLEENWCHDALKGPPC